MAELIRGKIYKMSPAPTSKHQKVVGILFGLLWSSLRGERCQVFKAPFDVRLPISPKMKGDKNITTVVQIYEEAGVKEYWAIHPQEQTVLVYMLNTKGKYDGILQPYICTDKIRSTVLPVISIDLSEVFLPEIQ